MKDTTFTLLCILLILIGISPLWWLSYIVIDKYPTDSCIWGDPINLNENDEVVLIYKNYALSHNGQELTQIDLYPPMSNSDPNIIPLESNNHFSTNGVKSEPFFFTNTNRDILFANSYYFKSSLQIVDATEDNNNIKDKEIPIGKFEIRNPSDYWRNEDLSEILIHMRIIKTYHTRDSSICFAGGMGDNQHRTIAIYDGEYRDEDERKKLNFEVHFREGNPGDLILDIPGNETP